MKKPIILLAICALGMGACKKENVEQSLTNQQKQGFQPKLEEIVPLIEAFKETAKADLLGTAKTSSTQNMPTTQAEWMLEGAVNYDNAHPVQMYDDANLDTLVVTVSNVGTQQNGEEVIDGGSLAQAYANLTTAINNLTNGDEEVDVVDVFVSHQNEYTTTFEAVVSSGFPISISPDFITPFDNWKAGEGLGKCDGTMTGADAASRITGLLNFNIANGFVQNFSGNYPSSAIVVYTSVESMTPNNGYLVSDYDNFLGQSNDPFQFVGGPLKPATYCVSSSEMQDYVDNAWNLASLKQPFGKDIIQLLVKDAPYWSPNGAVVNHYMHHINYGIPVFYTP